MFFACCFVSKPVESRVQKHCSWTNWFSICVSSERGMCSKDRLSRAHRVVDNSCWNSFFAGENNGIFLGNQLLGLPVGCALAVFCDELMPSDLPPNPPCSKGLSWVQGSEEKITIICMNSLCAQESQPRTPSGQACWKHGGRKALPLRCTSKMGLAAGSRGTVWSPCSPLDPRR